MMIEELDVGEYDEADRTYNSTLLGMYRYMVHVKPYVIAELVENKDPEFIANLTGVYANMCMTFGEFMSMTRAQFPNIAFKRKFYEESMKKFGGLLNDYKKLSKNDNLVLTEAEKKITL